MVNLTKKAYRMRIWRQGKPQGKAADLRVVKGLVGLALLVLADLGGATAAEGEADGPVAVRSAALQLNPEQPEQDRLGALRYVGGLVLASDDPRFGGYSGLAVDPDGKGAWAISDLGHWLRLEFALSGDGVPTAVTAARLLILRDANGRAMQRKADNDAEALRRLAGGTWLVSFERWHRLWIYEQPGGRAVMHLPLPPTADRQPNNGGFEAAAVLPDGGLLLFSEDMLHGGEQDGAAWLQRRGNWQSRVWPVSDGFKPTDAAILPPGGRDGGDVLVLERYFTPVSGPKARLRRVAASQLDRRQALAPTTLAEWARPVSVDNMEGLDARRAASGATLLYILSDDNRNSLQRTLLMVFRLDEN